MNDHYVHDGGQFSAQFCVSSEKCYAPLSVQIGASIHLDLY